MTYSAGMMDPSTRIQDYFRASAAQRYEMLPLPPFSLFFHPTDKFPDFNYATPDRPNVDGARVALTKVEREYHARGLQPRLEFVEEYAPRLPTILVDAGWEEQGRHILMACTPDRWDPAAAVDGLEIQTVCADASTDVVRQFMAVQRAGFAQAEGVVTVSDDEVKLFRPTIANGAAFLAFLDGAPVSAAMYTTPIDGVTELVGIATAPNYRRRGIASAITGHALQAAFADSAVIACLSAGDERAGRVYARVGFESVGLMLIYACI